MTISPDARTRSIPPLEHSLEDGWTLPASWYSDTAVAERERELIFARSWQYGGPAEHVAKPGSYMAMQAGHIPLVVTRSRDGELRAFVNVCRHRAYLIARDHGCRETLQCPYHAWTYDLDGSLKRVPRSEREEGFNPADFSLLPASVDTWGRSCLSIPIPMRLRSRRRSAPSPTSSPVAASISLRSGSTRRVRGRSRRTGRLHSRTTSSATTARRLTPVSAR